MRDVIEVIRDIDINLLTNEKFVIDLIREYGLHNDPCVNNLYGKENQPYLVSEGILQIPKQLASVLIYLSDFVIDTYLEIGTFNGKSTLFITAYLTRFNPDLKTLTVDNARVFQNPYKHLKITQLLGTSDDLKDTPSDLCFIDGDHSLEWVKRDYENVGKSAKIRMFHDILETKSVNNNDMDVKNFWQSIKRPLSKEFTDGGRLGIGIL